MLRVFASRTTAVMVKMETIPGIASGCAEWQEVMEGVAGSRYPASVECCRE